MNLLNEIQEYFAAKVNGMRPLLNIPEDYPAYTFRDNHTFGVAIHCDYEKAVVENSANARMELKSFIMDGKPQNFLILKCSDENLRLEFARICMQFIDPGEDGELRKSLLKDPVAWWNRWTDLLGNKKTSKECYSVIAELIVLDYLFQKDNTIVWAAEHAGSHDIESASASFEVKSTVKKTETTVTISSQYQLYSTKPLSLYFCRMEQSLAGFSINDMVGILVSHGYDNGLLEHQLSSFGFEKGTSARDIKYKVLERRKYIVDENFPKITHESFKGNKFPTAVTKIIYTIDLSNISYEIW